MMCFSCTSSSESVEMKNVNNLWNKDKILSFNVKSKENNVPQNISFVVRNNNNYPFSNIRLIVSLESPSKKISIDTLNYILAKPDGEWIGTGFGETKEISFQYKTNYTLKEAGIYQLKIRQAMRRDLLPGIEDFGVKIESSKP